MNKGLDVPLRKIKVKRVNGKLVKVRYKTKFDVEEKKLKKRDTNDLDNLFRKTQTKPHMYYLPLSHEEVAAKRLKRNSELANNTEKQPQQHIQKVTGLVENTNNNVDNNKTNHDNTEFLNSTNVIKNKEKE